MARPLGVGELARRGGVSVRTLQHYDHLGLLPAGRDEAGLRCYQEDDLATLQQIQFLQGTGLSLREVGEALRSTRRTALYAAALSVEALLLVANGIDPGSTLGLDLGRRWQVFADSTVAGDAHLAAGYASVADQDDRWPAADRDLKRRTEGFVDRCLTAQLADAAARGPAAALSSPS